MSSICSLGNTVHFTHWCRKRWLAISNCGTALSLFALGSFGLDKLRLRLRDNYINQLVHGGCWHMHDNWSLWLNASVPTHTLPGRQLFQIWNVGLVLAYLSCLFLLFHIRRLFLARLNATDRSLTRISLIRPILLIQRFGWFFILAGWPIAHWSRVSIVPVQITLKIVVPLWIQNIGRAGVYSALWPLLAHTLALPFSVVVNLGLLECKCSLSKSLFLARLTCLLIDKLFPFWLFRIRAEMT